MSNPDTIHMLEHKSSCLCKSYPLLTSLGLCFDSPLPNLTGIRASHLSLLRVLQRNGILKSNSSVQTCQSYWQPRNTIFMTTLRVRSAIRSNANGLTPFPDNAAIAQLAARNVKVISSEQGRECANLLGCYDFVECSSLTQYNIDKVSDRNYHSNHTAFTLSLFL